MFWLLDETGQSVSLNVHQADVPSDLLHSHSSVSCSFYGNHLQLNFHDVNKCFVYSSNSEVTI